MFCSLIEVVIKLNFSFMVKYKVIPYVYIVNLILILLLELIFNERNYLSDEQRLNGALWMNTDYYLELTWSGCGVCIFSLAIFLK